MKKEITFAFIILFILALVIWFISKYIQPILPPIINYDLLLYIAGLIGVATILSSINDVNDLFQRIEENKDKKLLEDQFSQGPFDKETIDRSTRNYIQPKCTNIDPAQEKEPRHALYAIRELLFPKIDQFLVEDNYGRHLLILADSGTGKTSCILN